MAKPNRMDYKEYKLIDFLGDETFRDWVLNPDPSREIFWQEWLKAHPDKMEDFQKAHQIILSMKPHELPSDNHKSEVLQKILQGDKSERSTNRIQKHNSPASPFSLVAKIAASLVLLAGLTYFLNQSFPIDQQINNSSPQLIVKENPNGRKSTFRLPDGSLVVLNAASTLQYSSEYDSLNRTIYLSGEAFFEVEKNPALPFEVIANGVRTTAIGTAFNVKAWTQASLTEIALAEGRVKLDRKEFGQDAAAVLLEPGQKAIYPDSQSEPILESFDPVQEYGWKDGILVFNHASLPEFIDQVERWYGVEVTVEGNSAVDWSIDGKFDNESLREIMEGLSYTYNITYTLEKDTVILKL